MARGGVRVPITGDTTGLRAATKEAEAELTGFAARARAVSEKADLAGGAGKFGGLLGAAGVGGAALAGLGAATIAITGFTHAAIEAQVAESHFDVSLKNAGISADANRERIEKLLTAARQLGFTDEQTRQSLSITVRRTRDLGQAWQLTTLAMDLARSKNIDLDQATALVTRSSLGNTRALKSLGIEVEKGASQTQILTKLYQTLHGEAAHFATTDAGNIDTFHAQWLKLQRTLGQSLLPLVAKVSSAISAAVEHITVWWTKNHAEIEAVTKRVWGFIKTHIGDQLKNILNVFKFFFDLLRGDWGKAFGTDLPNIVKGAFWSMVHEIEGWGETFGQLGLKLGKAIGEGIANAAISGINAVLQFLKDHWPDIPGLPGPPGLLPTFGGGGTDAGGGSFSAPAGTGFAAPAGGGRVATGSSRSAGDYFGGGSVTAPSSSGGGGASGGGSVRMPSAFGDQRLIRTPGSVGRGSGASQESLRQLLAPAISWCEAQMGKRYSQQQRLGPDSFDCSGFAGVAASKCGSSCPVGGTTYTYFPGSSPARGDEPVVWGFARFGADGHQGPGHMGIRILGTWYQAGSTATGLHKGGDFASLRVPPGLEHLAQMSAGDAGSVPAPRSAGASFNPLAVGKGIIAAAAAVAGLAKLTGPLGTSQPVPQSGLTAKEQTKVTAVGTLAANQAAAAGMSADQIRRTKEDAEKKETKKILEADVRKASTRRGVVKRELVQLRGRLKELHKGMPLRGPAKQTRLTAIKKVHDAIVAHMQEVAGLNSYISELQSQAQDIDIDLRAEAEQDAGGAAADQPSAGEVALALAGLTPGADDDIAALRQIQDEAQAEFDAAQQSGDARRIVDAANALKGAQDALASALKQQADAVQQQAGLTADQTAQIDQANANAASAQAYAAAEDAFIRAAFGPGDIGEGASSAIAAAGGRITIINNIPSLVPTADPATLRTISDAVMAAFQGQGTISASRIVTG